MQLLEAGERRCDVALHDLLEEIDDHGAVGKAEHLADFFRRYLAGAVGDRLIEQREGVARRTFGGARDHGQGAIVDGDIFPRRDALHQANEAAGLDAAEGRSAGSATGR